MLRSYLISAVRHFVRNKFYAGIAIFCLSVGLCVALFVGLIIRQELAFEHFLPNYQRTFVALSAIAPAGRPPMYFQESPGFVAASMNRMFPEIEAITRIVYAPVRLRRGQFENKELVYWADPNVFDVLLLPAVEGDLRTALKQPDGIVLTQSIARKYFGAEPAIGQTLLLNGQNVQKVTAVIKDLPAYGTILGSGIFVSGLAAYSRVAKCDRNDIENAKSGGVELCGMTLFRLREHTGIDRLRGNEKALIDSFPPLPPMMRAQSPFIRIDDVHLFEGLHAGARLRVAETAAIGLLILFTACVVYVNLTTARSSRRALEVGIRKVCGAGRTALAVQLLGESILYTALGSVVAVSLAELTLPFINSFLALHVEFNYWRDPHLLGEIMLGALLVGILSGIYPALVLSRFSPIEVLKGPVGISGGTAARQLMVVAQLAILIGLLSGAGFIYLQRQFATHDAVRLKTAHALVLAGPCVPSLLESIRKRSDVDAVTCSGNELLDSRIFSFSKLKDGTPITVNDVRLDLDVFRFYGIPMLAGTLEPRDVNNIGAADAGRVIINESLAKALGFRSPAGALGHALELRDSDDSRVSEIDVNKDPAAQPFIIGVVPDFAFSSAKEPVRPTIFRSLKHDVAPSPIFVDESGSVVDWGVLIHVRLNGRATPQTPLAIDALWTDATREAHVGAGTIWRRFLSEYLEELYQDVLSQAHAFSLFSIVALSLSSFGLLGLAAAAAERRTKEIGIRKAMGAGRSEILGMLLRQFTLPVLWASLIAWPVSALLINRWLETFAQHIRLTPAVFLASSGLTLIICLLTVSAYAWRVANAPPVTALRYE
jgi:putative ABC transport system permease protein